jgi:predicted transcriptional regulator of viral defense system
MPPFFRQVLARIAWPSTAKRESQVVNSLRLRFVRFSRNALTQDVVNTRIDGVPVRIYSVAKTIADCLKYRRMIGPRLAIQALREGIAQRKRSRERLQHFAKMWRVNRLLRIALKANERTKPDQYTRFS